MPQAIRVARQKGPVVLLIPGSTGTRNKQITRVITRSRADVQMTRGRFPVWVIRSVRGMTVLRPRSWLWVNGAGGGLGVGRFCSFEVRVEESEENTAHKSSDRIQLAFYFCIPLD